MRFVSFPTVWGMCYTQYSPDTVLTSALLYPVLTNTLRLQYFTECSTHQYFMVPHGFADILYTGRLSALHGVVALHLTDVAQEVLHHLLPVLRQVHFRVELNAVNLQLVIGDSCWKETAMSYIS